LSSKDRAMPASTAGISTLGYECTVHVNEVAPLPPLASVAVTVTVEVPILFGVPEMRPEPLIVSPCGNPLAFHATVKPPESVADIWSVTEVLRLVDRLPGFVTVIVFGPVVTVQLNVAVPETPVTVSLAVTVTAAAGAAAWVVPEMTPLDALMLNPAGSPVAAHCREGLALVSVACSARETAVLDLVD
jgi:hypothetical protein